MYKLVRCVAQRYNNNNNNNNNNAYTLGVKPKEKNQRRAKNAEGGNRRERKLKAEMKRLRQDIARAGNELHKRKQRRKATKREKEIINQLRASMDGKEVTSGNLRAAKEQWLDKLRYKKVKLDKYVEKGNKKKDNIMFQKELFSYAVESREARR